MICACCYACAIPTSPAHVNYHGMFFCSLDNLSVLFSVQFHAREVNVRVRERNGRQYVT